MEKVIKIGGFPLAPLPVALISCGTMTEPKVLTVSWTGIASSNPFRLYISVQPTRNSFPYIKESGEFTVNIPDESLLTIVDYCGTHSGRDVDKFAVCHLTPEQGKYISAPMIAECPVSIECRVYQSIDLGSHEMFIADILATHIAPEAMNGIKFDFAKVRPIAYANSNYYTLGGHLGKLGQFKDE